MFIKELLSSAIVLWFYSKFEKTLKFYTFAPSKRGALNIRAEIIPVEPALDNAGEGN